MIIRRRFSVFLLLLCIFAFTGTAKSVTKENLSDWGKETIATLKSEFCLPNGLYAGSPGDTGQTFAWGHGIMLNAMTAAARVDSSYISEAESLASKIQSSFWCSWGGYNASAGGCGDRYSDDSAWIILGMLELYEITGNEKYLDWSRAGQEFVMSWENPAPSGGIRWHENNTCGTRMCSTSPVCLLNMKLYRITGESEYLESALRLYNYVKAAGGQNSTTGLYYEGINCDGTIDYAQLGYDTAPMLEATIIMYEVASDDDNQAAEAALNLDEPQVYLAEAQRVAASMNGQIVNSYKHCLNQTGKWCGHDMTNAYVALYEVDGDQHWLDIAAGYLEFLHENCLFDGLYTTDWDDTSAPGSTDIIDNASAAIGYWTLARTNGGNAPEYPVVVCDDCSYEGRAKGLYLGNYNMNDLYLAGMSNDRISSLKVKDGYKVILYNDANYSGTNMTVTTDIQCLSSYGMDNKTTSLKIMNDCPPSEIHPYCQVNGQWYESAIMYVDAGDNIVLSPQADNGSWSWSGPNGFTSYSREISISNITGSDEGNYIATYSNSCGTTSEIVFSVDVYVPGEGANLALDKPVTADSFISAEYPALAVDGTSDDNSKWCTSSNTGNNWMVVDLENNYEVDTFVIHHSAAGGESSDWNTRSFRIEVSNDGVSDWQEVVSANANTKHISRHEIEPVTTRYVRLYITDPAQNTNTAVRIYDFEVYGKLSAVFNSEITYGNSASEGYNYQGSIANTNYDDGLVSYSKTAGSGWLNIALNGELSGIPTQDDTGMNYFTVKATDNQGSSSTTTLKINVNNTFRGELGLYDFSQLAAKWMYNDCSGDLCNGTDITGDGTVGIDDLQVMAGLWLSQQNQNRTSYWPFDADMSDASADNDGTAYGDAQISSDGILSPLGTAALLLDGDGDYVVFDGFKGITGTASRTCMAWVNTTSTSQGMIMSWGSSNVSEKWMFRIEPDGTLGLGIWGGAAATSATVNDGNWHHVAAVLNDDGDPDISEVLFYIDGQLQESTSINNQAINTSDDNNLLIGAVNPDSPTAFFNGMIDDARLFNYALTSDEISNYALTNLDVYLPFSEGFGSTTADNSLNNRSATLNNQPSWMPDYGIDGAIQFDGTNDYVEVANYKGILGSASRTCTAWIKTETYNKFIMGWGTTDTGAKWLVRLHGDGTLRTEVSGGYIFGSTNIADNQWHHIAVVLPDDGSTDISEALLYVDGQLETNCSAAACPVNTASAENVKIGTHYASTAQYFNGMIDEVKIYNSALSEKDIKELYKTDLNR